VRQFLLETFDGHMYRGVSSPSLTGTVLSRELMERVEKLAGSLILLAGPALVLHPLRHPTAEARAIPGAALQKAARRRTFCVQMHSDWRRVPYGREFVPGSIPITFGRETRASRRITGQIGTERP